MATMRHAILGVGAGLLGLAVLASCGRAPSASNARALQNAAASAASTRYQASPCDHEVASRIPVNGPVPQGVVVRPGTTIAGTVPMPDVFYVASPNKNERPGGEKDVTAIVWHHTASAADAKRIAGFFSQPSAKVSAHYIVDFDGSVVRSVLDSEASWHAGRSAFDGRNSCNDFTIGIEICNKGDNTQEYPAVQQEAVVRLSAALMGLHGIGSVDRITRHRDVALPLGRKNDTSNNFPHVELKEKVKQLVEGAKRGQFLSGFLKLS